MSLRTEHRRGPLDAPRGCIPSSGEATDAVFTQAPKAGSEARSPPRPEVHGPGPPASLPVSRLPGRPETARGPQTDAVARPSAHQSDPSGCWGAGRSRRRAATGAPARASGDTGPRARRPGRLPSSTGRPPGPSALRVNCLREGGDLPEPIGPTRPSGLEGIPISVPAPPPANAPGRGQEAVLKGQGLGARSATSTEHRRGIFCPRQEQEVAVCLRQMRLSATQRGRKKPGEATEGFLAGFLASSALRSASVRPLQAQAPAPLQKETLLPPELRACCSAAVARMVNCSSLTASCGMPATPKEAVIRTLRGP